jgi:hypothetical protein
VELACERVEPLGRYRAGGDGDGQFMDLAPVAKIQQPIGGDRRVIAELRAAPPFELAELGVNPRQVYMVRRVLDLRRRPLRVADLDRPVLVG